MTRRLYSASSQHYGRFYFITFLKLLILFSRLCDLHILSNLSFYFFFLCCQITKKKAYALFSLVMRKLLKEMRNKTFLISVLILLDKWRETHFFDRHTLQETNSFFRISCKNVSKKACTHKTPIRL